MLDNEQDKYNTIHKMIENKFNKRYEKLETFIKHISHNIILNLVDEVENIKQRKQESYKRKK